MYRKGSCIVIPASTQTGAIEMAPTQQNIVEELLRQDMKISLGINKENFSSEQAISSPI